MRDTGSKTFLGQTGDLGAKQYCDAVLARPGCAPYVIGRLYARVVSSTAPDSATVARLLTAYGPKRDLRALFTAMLTDRSFAAAEGSFVIGPVEWLVGAMRALRSPVSTDQQIKAMAATLDSLGQLPFYPPSVGGWPSGAVWLSTAAADLRFRAATRLTRAGRPHDGHRQRPRPRLEAVGHLLGIATWSTPTLAVLKGSAFDPSAPRRGRPEHPRIPRPLTRSRKAPTAWTPSPAAGSCSPPASPAPALSSAGAALIDPRRAAVPGASTPARVRTPRCSSWSRSTAATTG